MYQKYLDVDEQGEGAFIQIKDEYGGSFYEWLIFCGHVQKEECHWTSAAEHVAHHFENVPEKEIEGAYGHLGGWIDMVAKYMEEEAYGEPQHIYAWGNTGRASLQWDWRLDYDSQPRPEKGSVPVTMFDLG